MTEKQAHLAKRNIVIGKLADKRSDALSQANHGDKRDSSYWYGQAEAYNVAINSILYMDL